MSKPSKQTRAQRRAADPTVQARAAEHEADRRRQDERAARDVRRTANAAVLKTARDAAIAIHTAGSHR